MVAIPARDEQAHLAACLEALAVQTDGRGHMLPVGAYGVLLLLNNCADASSELAHAVGQVFPVPLRIVERSLPPWRAHAGGARRLAMDLAGEWLREDAGDGLILTTDADSRVGLTWVAENLAGVAAGADAVAGDIALDPVDEARLPACLRARGALEATYGGQLIEISALLDPEAHNPWPHHRTISGASLAVTLDAYRRIGGLPALPLGEDKALISCLEAHHARIRFAPRIEVVTSGRLVGRAKGGVADTMKRRAEAPLTPCDEALEPLGLALARAHWRRRFRKLHAEGLLNEGRIAQRLGLSQTDAIEVARLRSVHAAWTLVEETSPVLRRRSLLARQLPLQIKRADSVLAQLRRRSETCGDAEPELISSFMASKGCERLYPLEQQV